MFLTGFLKLLGALEVFLSKFPQKAKRCYSQILITDIWKFFTAKIFIDLEYIESSCYKSEHFGARFTDIFF